MKSKTYVVAWDEVLKNTKDITAQLADGNHDYIVIDVSTSTDIADGWIKTGTVRYYNHFIWALSDFLSSDSDIFVFNAGDISFDNFSEYTSRAEKLFSEDQNMWLLAPNCGNDHFVNEGAKIVDSSKGEGLYLSTQTNGMWVFFNKELAIKMHEFLTWAVESWRLDFTDMVSGWGLDTVYCGMAIYNNKKIYRDASVLVSHPQSSSYDHAKATKEYYDVVYAYLDYVYVCGENRDIAAQICQTSYEKVNQKNNLQLSIKDVYLNIYNTLGGI